MSKPKKTIEDHLKHENDRFWAKVQKSEDPDGCWIWTAATTGNGPYGVFTTRGRAKVYAHDWSWIMANGTIPDLMELDHLCRNKLCVRPDHLEAVTHLENVRRAAKFRTHCPSGHLLDGMNGRGHRYCKTCNRLRAKANYEKGKNT